MVCVVSWLVLLVLVVLWGDSLLKIMELVLCEVMVLLGCCPVHVVLGHQKATTLLHPKYCRPVAAAAGVRRYKGRKWLLLMNKMMLWLDIVMQVVLLRRGLHELRYTSRMSGISERGGVTPRSIRGQIISTSTVLLTRAVLMLLGRLLTQALFSSIVCLSNLRKDRDGIDLYRR